MDDSTTGLGLDRCPYYLIEQFIFLNSILNCFVFCLFIRLSISHDNKLETHWQKESLRYSFAGETGWGKGISYEAMGPWRETCYNTVAGYVRFAAGQGFNHLAVIALLGVDI